MANMSYCRFENTARDLADCVDNWDDELREHEARARVHMFKLALRILDSEGVEYSQDEADEAIERLRESL